MPRRVLGANSVNVRSLQAVREAPIEGTYPGTATFPGTLGAYPSTTTYPAVYPAGGLYPGHGDELTLLPALPRTLTEVPA